MDTTTKKQIYVSIVFVALLVISIILIVSLAFFSNKKSAQGGITLGELDFCIFEDDSKIGNVLPGQTVEKKIYVANSRDKLQKDFSGLCDILIRFSVSIDGDDVPEDVKKLVDVSIENSEDFVRGDDYIYYCNKIDVGQKISLFDKIKFDAEIDNTMQQKNVEIKVVVDALQAENEAYLDVWKDAPSAWLEKIKKNIGA